MMSLCDCSKGVKSLGKERSARREEQLFKAVFSPRKLYRKLEVFPPGVLPQTRAKEKKVLAPRKCGSIFPSKNQFFECREADTFAVAAKASKVWGKN